MEPTGLELLLDLYECQSTALDDAAALERLVHEGVCLAGFDIVDRILHQFPHHGITLVLVLAQSHVTLHTWPEARYVTVDAYACGDSGILPALEALSRYLVEHLAPRSFDSKLEKRGTDSRTR